MERETVKRQSGATTLVWGRMAGAVAFFKTTGDGADGAEFETKRDPDPAEQAAEDSALRTALAASLPALDAPAQPQPARNPVRKGITRTDGTFLDLTEKLEQIDEATKLDNMRIYGFVADRIPRARVVGSYYLAGTDAESIRLCAALRHAMAKTRRWALVRWTKQKKQAVGVIAPGPRDTVLVLELVFAAQVREPNPRCMSAGQVELSPEEEDLAVQLVNEMRLPTNVLDTLEDDRVVQRRALRAAAEEGLLDAWEAPEASLPDKVSDLEVALRSSVRVVA
jgi:non-homologous end joining protein Ku